MKKKFLILLVIPFLLCGCKADYTLEIEENYIKETTSLYSDDKDEYNDMYRGVTLEKNLKSLSTLKQSAFINTSEDYVSNPEETESSDIGLPLYETKKINQTGTIGTSFTYTFGLDNYKDSYAPNVNARTFDYKKDDDTITLKLGDTYSFTSYKLLDTINVLIKVSDYYDVISNNAELINGNEYMWTITRDNYINKELSITLKAKSSSTTDNIDTKPNEPTDKTEETNKATKQDKNNIFKIIMFSLIGLFCLGIIFILIQKKMNNDRI